MAAQIAHSGCAVHLPTPVDEVIDHGLPAAVLVLHRLADGGSRTVMLLLELERLCEGLLPVLHTLPDLANHQEDVATVSRVPRDPQLDCLARVLVLFTGSDPAGQTHTTVALIDAPTGSTAVLYLASEPFKPLLFSHGEQIFPGEQKWADMGLPR